MSDCKLSTTQASPTHGNRRTSRPGSCRILLPLLFGLVFLTIPAKASGFSLALDSIAEWGKFPRFCINTYRWGSDFFNSYDSTYVEGSGKLFNIKTRVESWTDNYNFRFDNGYRMEMLSKPSTSLGVYLTYMAVSLGYDLDFGKIFNGASRSRKKFNFQFNCSLFAADCYWITNDVGTTIKRIGSPEASRKVDIPFKGIDTRLWGVDLYYFFNHRHYSQAAAFSYSKIQRKSSGSLYAGLSFWGQNYKFDFTDFAEQFAPGKPESWSYHYQVKNKNYALKIGYAYNWVFRRGWVLGISEAPTFGIRKGYINTPDHTRTTFAMSNRARASIIYNHEKKWFFGIVANADTGLIYDKEHTFANAFITGQASVGYRFNLW